MHNSELEILLRVSYLAVCYCLRMEILSSYLDIFPQAIHKCYIIYSLQVASLTSATSPLVCPHEKSGACSPLHSAEVWGVLHLRLCYHRQFSPHCRYR